MTNLSKCSLLDCFLVAIAVTISLVICPRHVTAQTQDQNRVSGSEFGPLSFTEPGQTDAASLASRPGLKLNRSPAQSRLYGNLLRNGTHNNSRRLRSFDDGIPSFDSQESFMSRLPEWSFNDNSLEKFAPSNYDIDSCHMGNRTNHMSSIYSAKIEQSDSLTRDSYSTHSGDWLPSKIDLFNNGAFGVRPPNGFVDKTPPNGRVEETF